MNSLKRHPYALLITATILLPIWVGLGRISFGVGGWGIFLTIPAALLLVIVLGILCVLTLSRRDVREQNELTSRETGLWIGLIACAVLNQLTLVDGGDSQDSIKSVLTAATGTRLTESGSTPVIFDISDVIFYITGIAMAVILVLLFTYTIRYRVELRNKAQIN